MDKLPTLADIQLDPTTAFKQDSLNYLLSQPPPSAWVKKHPIAKNEYLPIDKVKFLLRKIFKKFRIEIIDKGIIFQSVFVHARVHYLDPVTGEWDYHDGIGAVGVQTDAGKPASDLGAIKSDAIMKALPAAYSYAIKDACDHFGPIFGDGLGKELATFAPFVPDTSKNGLQESQPKQTTSTNDFNPSDL